VNRQRISPSLKVFAGIAAIFVALPLISILVRTPWSDLGEMLSQKSTRDALSISIQTSIIAALISCAFGVPLAWLLARSTARGIALLTAFGRQGLVGRFLYDWFDVSLPFTRTAVVMAQVFVAMPFLVLAVEASFRQSDKGLEEAARTMGASPSRVFFTVALPAARPAIIAGLALAWARSLGEFGASITFAGSFPGRTQTLPMAVYELVSVDYRWSLVLSLVLILISVGVLAAMRDRWMVGR
jgi:molybdate transport system permease protein